MSKIINPAILPHAAKKLFQATQQATLNTTPESEHLKGFKKDESLPKKIQIRENKFSHYTQKSSTRVNNTISVDAVLKDKTPISDKPDKKAKLISDSTALMTSLLLLHVPMIAASNVSRNAVQNGIPAKKTLASMLQWPMADWSKASKEIISRRIYANLLPALLTGTFAKDSGLSPLSITALNSFYETVISIAVVSESNARFEIALRDDFPLYNSKGVKAKLVDIKTEKQFFELAKNHESTKDFSQKDWIKFDKSRDIQLGNLKAQAVTIFGRNSVTVASALYARTMATNIAAYFEENLDALGVSQNAAIEVLTYGVRASLSFATAPIDRVLTMLSSGSETASQVTSHLIHDVKTGEIQKLFRGALARTVFCTITASSIGEAMRASRIFQSMTDEDWKEAMDHIKMPNLSKAIEAMPTDLENIDWQKIKEDAREYGSDFYENKTQDMPKIQEMLSVLGQELTQSQEDEKESDALESKESKPVNVQKLETPNSVIIPQTVRNPSNEQDSQDQKKSGGR